MKCLFVVAVFSRLLLFLVRFLFFLSNFSSTVFLTILTAVENIAYGKICNQSSYTSSFTAFYTVDGNLSTCFRANTGYQWIYIDLIWNYNVQNVTLFRLKSSNYTSVLLSKRRIINDEEVNSIDCPFTFHGTTKGTTTYDCSQNYWFISKYVSVIQSGEANVSFSICEIEISGIWAEFYSRRENVLLMKPATSYNDSKIDQIKPANAVDGIRDTLQGHGFCFESPEANFYQNWIMIDMLDTYIIDYIAFTIRSSVNASGRAENFTIGFSETNFSSIVRETYPLCGRYSDKVESGGRFIMKCNSNLPAYRYLIAQQAVGAFDGYFGCCELEAYAVLDKNSKFWNVIAKDKRLSFGSFIELACPTISRCSFYSEYLAGDSFNFNSQQGLCEINRHINGYLPKNLETSRGWSFWVSVYSSS